VNNINLMQVIHSLGHIRSNSYHIWELKTSSSIVKEVENTPSMHEFCNYTQNRWSRACTNKLDNILVTNFSVEIGLNMVGEGDRTDQ
jgi:hypothetical protein